MTDELESADDPATSADGLDEEIRILVDRLARPHRSGGRVIERASLLAAGTDFRAAIAWIEAHGGEPELPTSTPTKRGVHSARLAAGGNRDATPLRFILPTAAPR